MARKVFFSFHYQRDLWRVNVIRNSGLIEGVAAAGFADASLWEATKRQGDLAVKKLIDNGLKGTSVTVVLVGAETASRRYVSYEIEKSIALGHGLLGIYISAIKDMNGRIDPQGPAPAVLIKSGVPIYHWQYGKLGEWVDTAFKRAIT